jgi:anti-sigma B factor antagonist
LAINPTEITMDMNERQVGGVTVLDLNGKLTIENAQLLRDKFHGLVDQGRKQLILNLGDVPYIDSGGLGVLVAAYTTLKRSGGRLTLMKVNKKNHDLLSITRLVTVFETYDSEPEAVASYSAAAS